jgi:hypothetical protein
MKCDIHCNGGIMEKDIYGNYLYEKQISKNIVFYFGTQGFRCFKIMVSLGMENCFQLGVFYMGIDFNCL